MSVPALVWVVTIVGLAAVIVVDLVVIGRRRRSVTLRDALVWIGIYVALAAVFAVGLFLWGEQGAGSAFVAGYVTEYSLSVDNLFVFMIIIARFAVPPEAEDKVLYIGIILSLGLRAIFIFAGAAVLVSAQWIFYILGAFLIYSAIRLALEGENDDSDFREGASVRLMRRILPLSTEYSGRKLAIREGGRMLFTPLTLVVGAIAIANVVFALDSIPAIFGLTTDAYVIFTANALALLGLRQLYFLVGRLLKRLIYLNLGLAAILAFIGVKLVFEALRGSGITRVGPVAVPDIPTFTSMLVILGILVVTAAASLAVSSRQNTTTG
jgi:TerC family integral membrane protein